MELRSTRRSRSKTPFTITTFDQENGAQEEHFSVTKSTRRSTTTLLRSENHSSSANINEQYSSQSKYYKPSKTFSRSSNLYKTSDYSSEEGENEVSSSSTSKRMDENLINRMREDAKAAAEETEGVTALGLYRRAKRYWEEYPKTDWTYSRFSKDRVELAPGVVAMPNMSRRRIGSDASTNTEYEFVRSSIRPQKLFSTNSFEDSYSIKSKSSSFTYKIYTLISTLVISVLSVIVYGYRSVNSVFISVAKLIHRVCSRMMLFETWLLRSRTSTDKTRALIALCLIPMLLFGGWWLLTSFGGTISESFPNIFPISTTSEPVVSMSSPFDEFKHFDNPPEENVLKIIEKVYVEPPTPEEIASRLTKEQLNAIAGIIQNNINLNQNEIVYKILNSPSIQNVINNNRYQNSDETNLNIKIENQENIIKNVENELERIKVEVVNILDRREKDLSKILEQIKLENQQNTARLTYQLNRCCKKSIIDLEGYVSNLVNSFFNNKEFLYNQNGLNDYLRNMFAAKSDLEHRISNLTQTLDEKFDGLIKSNGQLLMNEITHRIGIELKKRTDDVVSKRYVNTDSLSDEYVKKIVIDSLKIYDADRTGLVDYAMEPMGGQILTTRCTESYHSGSAVVSVLGLPLWYPTISPRVVVTPGINPGECWAFQNFPGLLVIKLAAPIKVEAFSVEHVSKLLVPNGRIDSAPKNFEVFGLETENDKVGVKLGEYVYDYDGEGLQFFAAQQHGLAFEYIELRMISNHGNPNYTCLYRFRVHGTLVE